MASLAAWQIERGFRFMWTNWKMGREGAPSFRSPAVGNTLSGSECDCNAESNRAEYYGAVAKPFIVPRHAPYVATAFEQQAQKLGLTEQTYESSEEMRQWCRRNKDRYYVPEWLLKRWQISVDPNFSA